MISQLEEETKEGRGRAAAARQERETAEARKRERLKAAFLRRQLEAKKAKTAEPQDPAPQQGILKM